MKLLFSTRDLEIGGHPVENFPLLIDDDCMPLQPAQDFLLYTLLELFCCGWFLYCVYVVVLM